MGRLISIILGWFTHRPDPVPTPPPTPTPTPPHPAGSDPYGFTAWLNATRGAFGLNPVVYSAELAADAAENNDHQRRGGLGHYIMGSAMRQNVAKDPDGSGISPCDMWMNSPAHRSAMLDPMMTQIGIAQSGDYWTLNLR